MEKEPRSIIIGMGQSAKPFPREMSVEPGESPLSPLEKMHARAIAVVGNSKKYRDAEIRLYGADTSGYQEAEEMKKFILTTHPQLEDRIIVFNDMVDTSIQSERIGDEISKFQNQPEVVLVAPTDHVRRSQGQIEAWGTNLDKVYESHWVYVKEPGITEEERDRRQDEVLEIYFTKLMYISLMREFGLNVLGLADAKGFLIRMISERFRKAG